MKFFERFTVTTCFLFLCVVASCRQDISSKKKTSVELQGKHATDDAIKALNPDIVEFKLSLGPNSKVSLEGLKSISRLVNVNYVRFSFPSDTVTDPQFAFTALDALKGAKGIEKLHLTGKHFTPEVLSHVSELKSLKELILQDTYMSGWNLEGLEEHPSLEILIVVCSGISKKGIDNLSRLPKLRIFLHAQTGITDEVIETLQKQCPDLRIKHTSF